MISSGKLSAFLHTFSFSSVVPSHSCLNVSLGLILSMVWRSSSVCNLQLGIASERTSGETGLVELFSWYCPLEGFDTVPDLELDVLVFLFNLES